MAFFECAFDMIERRSSQKTLLKSPFQGSLSLLQASQEFDMKFAELFPPMTGEKKLWTLHHFATECLANQTSSGSRSTIWLGLIMMEAKENPRCPSFTSPTRTEKSAGGRTTSTW